MAILVKVLDGPYELPNGRSYSTGDVVALTLPEYALVPPADWDVKLQDRPTFSTGGTWATGTPGPGVSRGGNLGQVLIKHSAGDYDTEWVDIPTKNVGLADVATNQSTASASYTNLATVGPTITRTLTAGQPCFVNVGVLMYSGTAGIYGWASFAISGAQTTAASDLNAVTWKIGTINSDTLLERTTIFVPSGGAGSYTFTMQYKAGGTVYFRNRRIIVIPL